MGPHVFGDGRLGCWFTAVLDEAGNPRQQAFTDKLRHRLPRVRPYGITDIFLPPEATLDDKKIVREAEFFAALYEPPPHGLTASNYAVRALGNISRLAVGASELNIEGVADDKLASFVRTTVDGIRRVKPHLRLRINVVPFKGAYLPMELFQSDPQLFLIVQNYLGNMDERVAEDEITRDLRAHGAPDEKVSVMYGAHVGEPRVRALPRIRWRGSLYQDDLMADAGLI